MVLDRERILQEQEKLRLLNQQLLTQVTALQNNPVRTKGDSDNNRSLDLRTFD